MFKENEPVQKVPDPENDFINLIFKHNFRIFYPSAPLKFFAMEQFGLKKTGCFQQWIGERGGDNFVCHRNRINDYFYAIIVIYACAPVCKTRCVVLLTMLRKSEQRRCFEPGDNIRSEVKGYLIMFEEKSEGEAVTRVPSLVASWSPGIPSLKPQCNVDSHEGNTQAEHEVTSLQSFKFGIYNKIRSNYRIFAFVTNVASMRSKIYRVAKDSQKNEQLW
ncbi:hypothetical protein CBL_07612 [Carabus blaptoides fortunei]